KLVTQAMTFWNATLAIPHARLEGKQDWRAWIRDGRSVEEARRFSILLYKELITHRGGRLV
nr:hypothetical protein [Tanacetum cinerariifolium]